MSGLLSYESRTQRENVPIMATIECLHRLFTTSYEPVVLLRSLGLQMTGAIQPIKVRNPINHVTTDHVILVLMIGFYNEMGPRNKITLLTHNAIVLFYLKIYVYSAQITVKCSENINNYYSFLHMAFSFW